MANTIKIGNLDISSFKVGGADCSIYLGDVKLYPQTNLPYDAEIEYLESKGTQYIDTLFKGNTTTTKLDISLMIKSNSTTQALFGSRNTPNISNINTSSIMMYKGNLRIDWAAGNSDTTIPFSINTIYNIEITRGYFKMNDAIYNYPDRTSINQNYNFLIGNFSNGSSTPFNGGLIGRIYSAKLYSNDELIMDLIPVRVGQVGYMYDKVSGQLFGNSGSGNFVLGADKN